MHHSVPESLSGIAPNYKVGPIKDITKQPFLVWSLYYHSYSNTILFNASSNEASQLLSGVKDNTGILPMRKLRQNNINRPIPMSLFYYFNLSPFLLQHTPK